MKKMCAALLALLLAFTVLGTALAQDSGRVSDEARALYDSRWFSENAYVDITPQDGEFKVQVRMGDSYEGGYCWEYSTVFNPETRRLIRVTPEDSERMAAVFDLLLGDNLEGRKAHIAEYGANFLDQADLS